MTRSDATRVWRSPGPGGRSGFSLVELVMVVWVLGIMMAIAIPTFGSARDNARVRFAAGCVAQEIRSASQLAYAHGRKYTLDAGTRSDELILTPQGLTGSTVLDLREASFRCVLVPSLLYPYVSSLPLDSGGDATGAVSWTIVSGGSALTVTQEVGVVDPALSTAKKSSAEEQSKYKLRILDLLL